MDQPKKDSLATEKISIRCTPELKAKIIAEAKKTGHKAGGWIVWKLGQIVDRIDPTNFLVEDPETVLARQLSPKPLAVVQSKSESKRNGKG